MTSIEIRKSLAGVPDRIRGAREANGMTQKQLAEKIKTTNMQISHIECGRRPPSLRKLVAIADALHVSLNHILLGTTV